MLQRASADTYAMVSFFSELHVYFISGVREGERGGERETVRGECPDTEQRKEVHFNNNRTCVQPSTWFGGMEKAYGACWLMNKLTQESVSRTVFVKFLKNWSASRSAN